MNEDHDNELDRKEKIFGIVILITCIISIILLVYDSLTHIVGV